MDELVIEKPYIKTDNVFSTIYCKVILHSKEKIIWFKLEKKYGKYLTVDRIDAYVIGLINYAMRQNLNIRSKTPVTEDLLYHLNEILIPALYKYGRRLHKIKIIAPTLKALNPGKEVGTGISCGVDSFYTVLKNVKTNYKSMNITHLCINNVGAFNECYGENRLFVKDERYKKAEEVARHLNLPLIKTDSNFYEAIDQNHYLTNTYSSCFAIYMLQKFWKIYYLASDGIDYSGFSLKDNDLTDPCEYALLSLPCFSTPTIKIYNDGGDVTRLEKTEYIASSKLVQNYLHVCTSKEYNCGVCPKCRRTLLMIDLTGNLDKFKNVFDIQYYKDNKDDYFKFLLEHHEGEYAINRPAYDRFLQREDFGKFLIRYKANHTTNESSSKKTKIKDIIIRVFPNNTKRGKIARKIYRKFR